MEVENNRTSRHESISHLLNVSTEKTIIRNSTIKFKDVHLQSLTKQNDSKVNFNVQLQKRFNDSTFKFKEVHLQNVSKKSAKQNDSKVNFNVQFQKSFNQSNEKQNIQKSKIQNISESVSLETSTLRSADPYPWKEIKNIANFTKSLSLEKSRLQKHFIESKEKKSQNSKYQNNSDSAPQQKSRSKEGFFQEIVPRLFSKMPVDCGGSICSLEFHHRPLVS